MDIHPNILATLAYYDIFDLPLKAEEIFARLVSFKHLDIDQPPTTNHKQPTDLNLVKKELDQLVLERAVDRAGEYYFLFDREYLIPLRLKHEKISKHKWWIAKHAIWWLRFVPYVRAVFASGSLALNNTDELSDLDILVVVKHGRIWLARFLITGFLSVLRLRRRGRDKVAPDKICLNHYITDKSLAINFKSIYNAQTYANLIPIYANPPDIIENFKKRNDWVLDFVKNWNLAKKPLFGAGWAGRLAGLSEVILGTRLGDWFEGLARRYQARRISRNPETNQPGGRIIFNDDQLEFHPRSIETEVINGYNERLAKLGLADLAHEKDSGLT